MARPTFPITSFPSQRIQFAAGIRFELIQDFLGLRLRLHHDVYMVGPNVRSQQIPTAVLTMLPDRCQNRRPTRLIQHIRLLEHSALFASDISLVRLQQAAAKQTVVPVDRPGLVAMEAGAVARGCDEISQAP